MPGGVVTTPTNSDRVEAPVTFKAYVLCAFAAFGGIFFGYDSGYISGVLGMNYFIHLFTGLSIPGPGASAAEIAAFVLPSWQKSLITSILSAGTFIGALMGGDLADLLGRRNTIIGGCCVFMVGVALQTASTGYKLASSLVGGRVLSGIGMGIVTAIIILYMAEIAPRKVRGAIISAYQFFITVGLLLGAVLDYATEGRNDTGSYRIPIGLQGLWAIILAVGLSFLPESPRYYVTQGRQDEAARSLARARGQPVDSDYIREELAEIVANYEHEKALIPSETYWSSWLSCFSGDLRSPGSNVRRVILGTSLQMMQQWTGVNFVFYFGTTFFQSLGVTTNPFLLSIATNIVSVLSTPLSWYAIEKWGRRPLLIWGAVGMTVCEFITAILGVAAESSQTILKVQVAFICIYIFFFSTTWGPAAWVCVGEIFPIPIRSRGVALSTASNWLWNCIIAVITPFMVDTDRGNLGSKVFFIWGSLCLLCIAYAYFFIWETKGLTLEQVDMLMEQVQSPRTSANWRPHAFKTDHGLTVGTDVAVGGEKTQVEAV
ncbi:High-affinity glucose transporter SNF3 [Saitozyma sp. JCM 24511]|nr:High-affinity glucose transporter SNF3 [Saitozyma sp. JCM 24511]